MKPDEGYRMEKTRYPVMEGEGKNEETAHLNPGNRTDMRRNDFCFAGKRTGMVRVHT